MSQTTDTLLWTIIHCHQPVLPKEDGSLLPSAVTWLFGLLPVSQGIKSMPSSAHCQDTQRPVWMLYLHPRGVGELLVSDRGGQDYFLKKQRGGYSPHSPQPHRGKHQLKAFAWQGLLFGNSRSPPGRLPSEWLLCHV